MLVFNETELQLLYNFDFVQWNSHNELFYKFRASWKEEKQGFFSWNFYFEWTGMPRLCIPLELASHVER